MKKTKTHIKSLEAIANGIHSADEISKFAAVTRQTILKALGQLVEAGEITCSEGFYQIQQQVKTGEKLSPTSETPAKSAKIRFKNPQNVGYLKKIFAFFGYQIQTANMMLFTVSPKSNYPNAAILEDLESILCFFSNTHKIDITGENGQYEPLTQLSKLNPKNGIVVGQKFIHRIEHYTVFHVVSKCLIPDPFRTDKEPACRIEFRALNQSGEIMDFVVDTSRPNIIEHKTPKSTKFSQRANFEAVKNYIND
jgi:hypothetical protein